MASIFILTNDAFLHILKHLDIEDRIGFACTCGRFRRVCMDGGVFRKMDFSKRPILRKQRGVINRFIRDEQMVQHTRELNLSNHRVWNWQMDVHLEKFISICPHLEALHVLNCGMSLQTLNRILQQAHELKTLSWSLLDFTSDDIEFLVNTMKSSNGVCLKNIKHLHLETFRSLSHIQIVKYLVLYCCKDLEELEIYTWWKYRAYYTGCHVALPEDWMIPPTSIVNMLQHLHSLTVVTMGDYVYTCLVPNYDDIYKAELSNFIFSAVRNKLSLTRWRKLWISPSAIGNSEQDVMDYPTDSSVLLCETCPRELHSVEAIAAHAGPSLNAVNELKKLFQSIDDNTVRSLCLCQCFSHNDSILELYRPILRVCGHALKILSLSFTSLQEIDAEKNVVFHNLFSNCLNITELDLLGCYFEKDICEPLSKLRHLTKVLLMECAIGSKYNRSEVEISKTNLLTFVENCQNITHFDVRGCYFLNNHKHYYYCLTDGDLLTFAKLKNLKSLTLYNLFGIKEWAFLQNISEHCKFLTMLRIFSAKEHLNKSRIRILLESAKFLKHLAISVLLDVGSEDFWNLFSRAKNLERLCIRWCDWQSINVPVLVEVLKRLPRLQVLHLHSFPVRNVEAFRNQMIRMLEEEKSDRRFFFELIINFHENMSPESLILNKALPLNELELCKMTPILRIRPRI